MSSHSTPEVSVPQIGALAAFRYEIAHQDALTAKARGAERLLDRVIEARLSCGLLEDERRMELSNAYRELTTPGPVITVDQVLRITGLLARR
jgi:hypothetical protein